MNETTLIKQNEAVAMQAETHSISQEVNTVYASSKMVPPVFHAHYVNMETQEHGREGLIKNCLRQKGECFTDTILEFCKEEFTKYGIRYNKHSIECCLSDLAKRGLIGKIKSSNADDYFRPCCRPRNKWYLIK